MVADGMRYLVIAHPSEFWKLAWIIQSWTLKGILQNRIDAKITRINDEGIACITIS